MPASKTKKASASVRITSLPRKHQTRSKSSIQPQGLSSQGSNKENATGEKEKERWHSRAKSTSRRDSKVSPTTEVLQSTLASSVCEPSLAVPTLHGEGAIALTEKDKSISKDELESLDISSFLTHAPRHDYHRPSVASASSSDISRLSTNDTDMSPALIFRKVCAPSPPSALEHCLSQTLLHSLPATSRPPAAISPLLKCQSFPGLGVSALPSSQSADHPQTPAPQQQQSSTNYPVYDHLSWTLSQPSPSLRLLYRTFTHLHHRLLLYLQEELCEVEEHVRYLDAEICCCQSQLQQLQQQYRECPREGDGGRDSEERYLDDLYIRRDDMMMIVQSRLKRYTEAISSVRQFNTMTTNVEATSKAVEDYKSWISANHACSHTNIFNWLNKPDIIDISANVSHTHTHKDQTHPNSLWNILAQEHLIQSIIITIIFVTLLLIPSIFWRLGILVAICTLWWSLKSSCCTQLKLVWRQNVQTMLKRWVC